MHRSVLFWAWLVVASAGALTCSAPGAPSGGQPVFGGEGAQVVRPGEIPLPAETATRPALAGPCGEAAPPGLGPLLENFEDGDNQLFKLFQREGWWYTAVDDTQGSAEPPPSQFKPVALSVADATPQNELAGHFVAQGYTAWGAVWGTTLVWVNEGIRCPFNASAFDGIRFRAKGKGTIRVNFGMPEMVPKDQGGVCDEGCYDTYGLVVRLKEEWTEFTVPWNLLQQGGWGKQARFDARRLLNLNFSAGPSQLPVDFWIDDLAFLVRGAAATPVVAAPSAPPPSTTSVPGTAIKQP